MFTKEGAVLQGGWLIGGVAVVALLLLSKQKGGYLGKMGEGFKAVIEEAKHKAGLMAGVAAGAATIAAVAVPEAAGAAAASAGPGAALAVPVLIEGLEAALKTKDLVDEATGEDEK